MRQGSSIPPTGLSRLYPLYGLCGCSQIQSWVGTGTQEAVVEAVVDAVVGTLVVVLVVVTGQGKTVVETLGPGGVGGDGYAGGYLVLQDDQEHLLPGHELPQ